MNNLDRRSFIKTTALTTAGIGLSTSAPALFKQSPNETVNVAVIGVNGRGTAHCKEFASIKNSRVAFVCDVDTAVFEKGTSVVEQTGAKEPKTEQDFRKILDNKDVDAVAIAAPDHWHTPMAIMALQAGKHVYLEKPCSHNPQEGEYLLQAIEKYQKVVQMGNQQRSAPTSIQGVQDIRDGLIGNAYYARGWYSNGRGSIGKGKKAQVPSTLDYELWQGPAPRKPYMNNIIHYNWHWFWNWGTGELINNGTHEVDICRWALGVDYPKSVISQGGRFHYDDDWEFWDTQIATFDYGDKMLTWEGKSCNNTPYEGLGRGSYIYGTEGSVFLDRNGYKLFDKGGKLVKEVKEEEQSLTLDTVGGGGLDTRHMTNFIQAVRIGEKLKSPISEGNISVNLCHLGNIAQATGERLEIDQTNGKITNSTEAMKMWGRTYEPGWEIKI